MARFDKFQQKLDGAAVDAVPEPAPTTNGAGTAHPTKAESDEPSEPASPTKRKVSDDEDLSDVIDSPPPKKAKKISNKSVAETDEELAKRMQAELNASGRSTRGGGTTKRKPGPKKAKPKSTPKKKSKAKINSDSDSNLSSSEEKPEKEKKGGFHKPMILSGPLSEMLGETQLSRPQTVKKIWAYVKERDLQDPSDKRQIRCDDAMRAVFKQERVHMFTMNKLLAAHLYAADE
jgi:upstream activation factor subunit UAF30